jgi:hypothetical protein
MFKKLSASILVLALVAVAVAPAQAQTEIVGTIGLYFAGPALPPADRFGNVAQGDLFDLVVVTKIDRESCASEFVMTELAVTTPGIFKINTQRVNGTPLDLGDNSAGEYIIAYGEACAAPGDVEVVRVSYLAQAGAPAPDTILELRGFQQPPDSRPSSFEGEMGWVDRNDEKFFLDSEPWPDGLVGNIDPLKLPNGGAGLCVLNADAVPTDANSMSSLKSRF